MFYHILGFVVHILVVASFLSYSRETRKQPNLKIPRRKTFLFLDKLHSLLEARFKGFLKGLNSPISFFGVYTRIGRAKNDKYKWSTIVSKENCRIGIFSYNVANAASDGIGG